MYSSDMYSPKCDAATLRNLSSIKENLTIRSVLRNITPIIRRHAEFSETSYTVVGLTSIDRNPKTSTKLIPRLPKHNIILSEMDKEAYLLAFQQYFKDCDVRWTPEGLRISWDLIPSDKT